MNDVPDFSSMKLVRIMNWETKEYYYGLEDDDEIIWSGEAVSEEITKRQIPKV